jgi:hypothetical protein
MIEGRSGLIISQFLLFVVLFVNCTNKHLKLNYIDNPESSYQYFLSKKGIIKAIHGHNELILFNTCLKRINSSDNIANNYPFEITKITGDSISVCLSFSNDEWEIYKDMYSRLIANKHMLGDLKISYSNIRVSNSSGGFSSPLLVDSLNIDCINFRICFFYKKQIIDSIEIKNLLFLSDGLKHKLVEVNNGLIRGIDMEYPLNSQIVLDKIIAKYRLNYCE